MKERWTVEIELDVELWEGRIKGHVDGEPYAEIYNGEDGLREVFLTGMHWHSFRHCEPEIEWKVIKREPIEEKVK